MKKNITIVLLCLVGIMIFFMIFFKQSTLKNVDISKKIMSPQNKLIPITGEWKVNKFKIINNNKNVKIDNKKLSDFIGERAIFTEKYATFADEVCANPIYKIKKVNAKEYLFYTYKVNLEDLNIKNNKVEIISIINEGKLFYDFIKIDKDTIIVYLNGLFLYLNNTNKKVDNALNLNELKSLNEGKKKGINNSNKSSKSGILIGLRESSSKDYNGEVKDKYKKSSYRTLWICCDNKNIKPILQVPNLFVPRMTGFWWLGVREKDKNSDELFAYPIDGKDMDSKSKSYKESNIKRDILFIGNDYVSVEVKDLKNTDKNVSKNILQVLPIDSVQDRKGIKISDISGKSGLKSFYNSAEAFRASHNKENIKGLEKEPRESSFTLGRKNGHWIMKGRLNSINPEDTRYADFDVNTMPSSKLLNYDEFWLSWSDIKSKVPDAKDAYTSPNKDICLILGKNYMYVYDINNNEVGNKLLAKIEIQTDETVVMSEWCTGDYINRWNKVLLNENHIVVKNNK